MAALNPIFSNPLECAVCIEEYSDQRVPQLLADCGHTFCEQCIAGLTARKDPCAECRTSILSKPIKNYALLSMARGMVGMVRSHLDKKVLNLEKQLEAKKTECVEATTLLQRAKQRITDQTQEIGDLEAKLVKTSLALEQQKETLDRCQTELDQAKETLQTKDAKLVKEQAKNREKAEKTQAYIDVLKRDIERLERELAGFRLEKALIEVPKLLSEEKYSEAIPFLRVVSAHSEGKQKAWAQWQLARALDKVSGKPEGAVLKEIETLLQEANRSGYLIDQEVRQALFVLLHGQKRYTEADEISRYWTSKIGSGEKDKESYRVFLQCVVDLWIAENREQEIINLLEKIEISPQEKELWFTRERFLCVLTDPSETEIRKLQQWAEDPTVPELIRKECCLDLAKAYMRRGKPEHLSKASTVLEKVSDCEDKQLLLGEIYRGIYQTTRIAKAYEKACEIFQALIANPNCSKSSQSEARYQMVPLFIGENNREKAASYVKELCEDPAVPSFVKNKTLNLLKSMLGVEDQPTFIPWEGFKTLKLYLRGLLEKPDSEMCPLEKSCVKRILAELSVSNAKTINQIQESLRFCNEVIQAKPGQVTDQDRNLALTIFEQLYHQVDLLRDYLEQKRPFVTEPVIKARIAKIQSDHLTHEQRFQEYEKLLREFPRRTPYRAVIATLASQKRYGDAEKILKEAIGKFDNSQAPLFFLEGIKLHLEQGRNAKARALFSKLPENRADPIWRGINLEVTLANGSPAERISFLETFVLPEESSSSLKVKVQVELAKAHLEQGNIRKAQEALSGLSLDDPRVQMVAGLIRDADKIERELLQTKPRPVAGRR